MRYIENAPQHGVSRWRSSRRTVTLNDARGEFNNHLAPMRREVTRLRRELGQVATTSTRTANGERIDAAVERVEQAGSQKAAVDVVVALLGLFLTMAGTALVGIA